jgi:hypothetical protein
LQGVTGGATPGLDEPVVTLQFNEDPVPLCELFTFPIFITITNYVLLSILDIGKTSLVLLFTKDIHVIDRVASKLMDTHKKSQLGEPDISSYLVRRFCLFSNLLPELPFHLFSWVSMVGSSWVIQSLTWIQPLPS